MVPEGRRLFPLVGVGASLGAWGDAEPRQDTGYRFIYDITAPVITAHTGVTSMSDSQASPTWLNSLTIASGTVTDNVSHILDPRQIYVRIYDITAQKYLNPITYKFDITEPTQGWYEVATKYDSW